MDWLTIVQLVFTYGPTVKSLFDQAISNDDLTSKMATLPKQVSAAFEQIGRTLFPDAAQTVHVIGGLIASIDPDYVKWIQGALNVIMPLEGIDLPALNVDGHYGAKTKAAVIEVQKKLGLAADGIVGSITQAAITALLTKN